MNQRTKTTLKHLKIQQNPHRKPHNIWKPVYPQVQNIRRAEIKSRLITGTYTLQENAAKYNNNQISSDCLLCKEDTETLEHFILSCKALKNIRNKYTHSIKRIIGDRRSMNLDQSDNLLQCILDCTHESIQNYLQLSSKQTRDIERCSQFLCWALHQERTRLISST